MNRFTFFLLTALVSLTLGLVEAYGDASAPPDPKACADLATANAAAAQHDHRLVADPGYLCGRAAEIAIDYGAGEGYEIHLAYFLWITPEYPNEIGLHLTIRFLRERNGVVESSYIDRDVGDYAPGTLTPWVVVTRPAPACRPTPFGCFSQVVPSGQLPEDPFAQ